MSGNRPPGATKRLREVVTVFMREGLQVPIARMRITSCASLKCRIHCTWKRWLGQHMSDKPWTDAVRDSFVLLGPAFVKAGQILSVRNDLIPQQLADSLKTLQSNVPPDPFDEIKTTIEKELGEPIASAFRTFQTEPLAAGSIAQVYRGTWRDGSEVAVKVKRPGIDSRIEEDLDILIWASELLEKRIPNSRKYRPTEAAQEIMRYTKKELDFNNEAKVAAMIAKAFSDDPNVLIPKIFFSTKHLIVMQFIDSFPIDDLPRLHKAKVDVNGLIKTGVQAMLKQIFDLGYFHGDPHPGNLHVTPEGQLVFLDFGIFGQLDERLRRNGALVLLELTQGNTDLMNHFLLQMADVSDTANVKSFLATVGDAYHKWRLSTISEYGFGKLVFQMFSAGAKYGVNFPSDLVLYSKAMLTIEGIALTLAPELNLADEAAPYFEHIKGKLFSLDSLKQQASNSVPLWLDVLDKLPIGLAFGLGRLINKPVTPEKTDNDSAPTQSASGPAIISCGLLISGSLLLLNDNRAETITTLGFGLLTLGILLSAIAIFKPKGRTSKT